MAKRKTPAKGVSTTPATPLPKTAVDTTASVVTAPKQVKVLIEEEVVEKIPPVVLEQETPPPLEEPLIEEKPPVTEEKMTTLMSSSRTVDKQAEENMAAHSSKELSLVDPTNATDISIANVLKLYVTQMAGNRSIDIQQLVSYQLNLWKALKMVYESDRNDYYRRWDIVMYYLNEGSGPNGAFTGMLPQRGINRLPEQIKAPMEALIGFLSPIAKASTRGIAIRNLSLERASEALPPQYRGGFLEYFGQYK